MPQESKVIELKYAAKTFGKMNEVERELSAYQLLLKIHAIRGWTIPASELMDILVTEFQKKLSEGYASVNEEEMMYAFRNSEMDVKDWGKALNLSLIDEVMIPYLEQRFELSKIEEQISKLKIEEPKELTDSDWEEWLLDIKNYQFNLIPVSAYEYLIRTGKINPTTEDKKKYMDSAATIYGANIQDDVRLWNHFIKQKTENNITTPHIDSLITISKRLIVKDYLCQ